MTGWASCSRSRCRRSPASTPVRRPTAFLERHGLDYAAIDRFICHPGGAKVVDALERAYELEPGTLADARAVLRDYGNMSAATVLFVLARALREPGWRRGLLTAMGPGFCAAYQMIER